MTCRIIILALICEAFASRGDLACVTSYDGSVTVCVQPDGSISSVTPLGRAYSLNASTLLEESVINGSALVSQPQVGGPITITRSWEFSPPGVGGAVVQDVLAPALSSITWNVSVLGTSANPWSVAIDTQFLFTPESYGALKLWSAWDRAASSSFPNSWVDPLQPSDLLPSGWWDGMYRLGSARASDVQGAVISTPPPCAASDFISVPLATVISSDPVGDADSGFTLLLSPDDSPYDTCFLVTGSQNAFSFQRYHHRLWSTQSVELHMQIAGHAADWRGGLGAAVAAAPEHFEPVNEEVFSCCAGTGSYSYYIGPLNTSSLDAVDYATNWDLSGRFFPYMGMFLPPVADGTAWLNDPEGTQPRANVTFESIGNWYRAMVDAGYTDLSYFNVNEFGINIQVPSTESTAHVESTPSSRGATCVNTWQNASACLASGFPDALLTHSYSAISGSLSTNAIYSWQNAVVVDPGVPSYHSFLLEQLVRHIDFEDAFAGIIIDRSDWQDLYNLAYDDGTSFLPEITSTGLAGHASSLKLSYLAMTRDLRASLSTAIAAAKSRRLATGRGPAPFGNGIMLMNTLGNARLDQLRWYDGTFSEGSSVNGVGILGAASPAILWTYDENECCSSAERVALYFQAHLYMGVCPMAPFPGNDHSIDPSPTAQAAYAAYGGLFRAIAPKVWALLPHIVSVVNGTALGDAYAKVNAFIVPVNGTTTSLIIPIVMAQPANGSVALNVTRADRVWGASPGGSPYRHPAVTHAPCAALDSGAAVSYSYSVQYPGGGGLWQPLLVTPEPSVVVSVPLPLGCDGAALVRVEMVTA